MASRKDLKKSVKAISDYYASAANVLQSFCDSEQQQKITDLILDLYTLENKTLEGVANSKESKEPLKKYFRELIADHNEQLDKIEEKLSSLEAEIFKGFASAPEEEKASSVE